ncbi:hypothetical protein ACVPOY_01525 [Staphylococcus aureus]
MIDSYFGSGYTQRKEAIVIRENGARLKQTHSGEEVVVKFV